MRICGNGKAGPTTIYRAIEPLTQVGDLRNLYRREGGPRPLSRSRRCGLGRRSRIHLSAAWPVSMGDTNLYRHFRILSAFWQIAQMAAKQVERRYHPGGCRPQPRSYKPLGSDRLRLCRYSARSRPFFSSGFEKSWAYPSCRGAMAGKKRLGNWSNPDFELPRGEMLPLGYIVQQHSVRLSRPVKAYDKWVNRMPTVYHDGCA